MSTSKDVITLLFLNIDFLPNNFFRTLLNRFIDDGLLNLSEMNFRILNFDYGQQKSNKPSEIEQSQLTKECINLYASEMMILMMKLPLIIGDLIPKQNKVWNWFLLFRNILDILLSKSLLKSEKALMQFYITDYIETRLTLFSDKDLINKHHHLLHYADVFLESGPIVNNRCMRFEAQHQVLIAYGKGFKKLQEPF